jgi:hypothetical protein
MPVAALPTIISAVVGFRGPSMGGGTPQSDLARLGCWVTCCMACNACRPARKARDVTSRRATALRASPSSGWIPHRATESLISMNPEDEIASPAPLEPQAREELEKALRKAYTKAEINRALKFEWGIGLEEVVNVDQGLIFIITELVDWTEREGKTWDLAAFLYRRRLGNPFLNSFAQKHEIGAAAPVPKPKPGDLESLVERSRFISVAAFEKQFRLVSRRLCKVVTPHKAGTGFLVADNMVLTAFHVVDGMPPKAAGGVACLFDYVSDRAEATRCELCDDWLVAHSPTGSALDFALMRLARPMGSKRGSQPARGWFKLSEALPVVNLRDLVLVPQHPKGRPQEVAWGEVTKYEVEKSQVRYDTSTEEGSSGAPCLTVELKLFGLHTNGGSTDNRGIPIRLIAADLREKGFQQEGFDA